MLMTSDLDKNALSTELRGFKELTKKDVVNIYKMCL